LGDEAPGRFFLTWCSILIVTQVTAEEDLEKKYSRKLKNKCPTFPDELPILTLAGCGCLSQTGVPLTIGQPRSDFRLVDEAVAGLAWWAGSI